MIYVIKRADEYHIQKFIIRLILHYEIGELAFINQKIKIFFYENT